MWVLELKLARIHEKLIFDRFISFFIITYPFQSLLSINCSILTFRKTRIWKFETGTRNRVGRLIDIEWNAFIHFPKFYISRDIIFLSFLFSFFFFKLSKMKKWFRRKEISRSDKIHVTCYCIYRPFQLNIYRSIYTHTRAYIHTGRHIDTRQPSATLSSHVTLLRTLIIPQACTARIIYLAVSPLPGLFDPRVRNT